MQLGSHSDLVAQPGVCVCVCMAGKELPGALDNNHVGLYFLAEYCDDFNETSREKLQHLLILMQLRERLGHLSPTFT